jgi:photosystem II stability/assembly factor-like uncharacterized protein
MRQAALILLLTITTNAQFQIQQSHTTADLRGIHSLGNGIAWASGTNGTILHTTDDGATWQLCTTPPNADKLDFRGIQAFDASAAIIMSSGKGDLSRLYKTTDACKSWKLVFTNPDKDGFWDTIRFDFTYSQNNRKGSEAGVLIGDPIAGQFVIYTTKNQGDSWQPWETNEGKEPHLRFKPAKASKGESLFAASNSAVFILSPNQFFFVTGGKGGSHIFAAEGHDPFDNGIMTWKFAVTKLALPSTETAGAFAIAGQPSGPYNDNVNLMVVGGDYRNPDTIGAAVFLPFREQNSFFAFDPNSQKVLKTQTPPHGYRSAVAYDTKSETWITVGPNGTDISTDDGKSWRALYPSTGDAADSDKNWNALSLPFVVGPNGRIGKLNPTALATKP